MRLDLEAVGQAFRIIVRYPGRSALTVLGLCIGVGAFIAMVSFGEGARRSVLSQFEALGVNLIKIKPRAVESGGRTEAQPLSADDVDALRREASAIASVVPVSETRIEISHGSVHESTSVEGTFPRFVVLHDWAVVAGGMFDAGDLGRRAKVCVLGATPARELFDGGDPLGQTVRLGEALTCHVIGVLEGKGYATSGADLDDVVLLPLTTHSVYLGRRAGYSYIEVEPITPTFAPAAKREAIEILRRSHRLAEGDFDDFSVSSPLEVIRAADRTSQILGGLLQGIAAVSLLVGGIGIMNIQLVSVAERTEEIGVRSAIGASPWQILVQFLLEALALSLVGVALGVLLGVGVAGLVARYMDWPRVISLTGVTLSAAFGLAVGIVFGYLPARRAARLDPIDALRHE